MLEPSSAVARNLRDLLLREIESDGYSVLEVEFADQVVFGDVFMRSWCEHNDIDVMYELYDGRSRGSQKDYAFYTFSKKDYETHASLSL